MPENTTETRTYTDLTGTQSFGGFLDMRQHYTGIVQRDGRLLVSAVGAPVGTGVLVTRAEWERWFVK